MKNIAYFFALFFYAISSALATEPVVWNGQIDTGWYDDEKNEFVISTAEELAGLAKLVNDGNDFKDKIVTLGADIMLNDTTGWESWNEASSDLNIWIPIGNISNGFGGNFDGANYFVSGIYVNTTDDYQGLFGTGSFIKNIGVLASFIKGGNNVGGIVGSTGWGGSMTNCHFRGIVNGTNRVGGIAGYNNGIQNSYSIGTVNGDGNVGGLVGYADVARVMASHSASIVTGNNIVGGIIGQVYTGSVQNSYFTGKVNGGNQAGGIAGRNDGTISNSHSTGEVSGSNSVGGIVGINYYSASVLNSYFTGNIIGNSGIGGIAGASGFMGSGRLINSYSTGNITGNSSVGGIVGISYDGSVINNYSVGAVNGTNKVGGIVGAINGGSTIANNYSSGTIDGIDSTGGIAGYNYRGKAFDNYWNATLNSEMLGVAEGAIGEDNIANIIGITELEMKEISFVEILNAFVDSVAQTGTIYHSWFLDVNNFNQGYPTFSLKLADATVSIATSSYIYNGNEYTPAVTVKLGDVTLTEEIDYFVSYADNTDAGNATINVAGIDNFTGTKTATFAITKKMPTVDDLNFTIPVDHIYNSSAQGIGAVEVKSPMTGIGIITVKYNGNTTIPTTAGTYTVMVDIEDGINFEAATEILLGSYTIKEGTSAIQKSIFASNISVLINAQSFQVQGITKAEKVQLINLKGSILLNKIVQPNESISIAHLPRGVYLVSIGNETKFLYNKR
ncbi:MAG: hypothetical protein LBU89_15080 [Fibromonadaceae bacterium]|jgi:hypothetical protein|nr:hypothetical protein [Fibromonadaceae bacterium]